MAIVKAEPIHEEVKQALMEALRPYQDKLSAQEILAVLSAMVGQAIALQDSTKHSPDTIMAMVSHNIELGNQSMIDQLMNSQGTA